METRYQAIKSNFSDTRAALNKISIQIDSLETQIMAYNNKIIKLDEMVLIYQQVVEVYKRVMSTRNNQVKSVLEDVLNRALGSIPLDTEYRAEIQGPDYTKANSSVVIKLIDQNSGKERTPLVGTGTMVSQLISFLMSAIVIKFSGKRRIMFLDEVLSGFYDKESIRLFGEILVALAENEGFQFIIVEHKSELERVSGINIVTVEKDDYDTGLFIESMEKGTGAED